MKKNSEVRIQESESILRLRSVTISRGLGPAQELLHHQIVDLVGVLNPVIQTLDDSLTLRYPLFRSKFIAEF